MIRMPLNFAQFQSNKVAWARYNTWRNQEAWHALYNELWEAIEEHGITAVRKAFKENNCKTPTLVKHPATGRYYYKYLSRLTCINGISSYWDSEYAPDRNEIIWSLRQGTKDYYRTSDYTYNLINGYPIEEWITRGEECEDCGNPFITTSHETICPVCREDYLVHAYSTRVETLLSFENTNEILYGIELEYENISARDVYKTLRGHALPKRDGTINNGLEIVTRPASMKTHKEKLKEFFSKVKVKAFPNTGMHVHIDKKKLTPIQIGTMQYFLNNPHNTESLIKIAGRTFNINTYCRTNTNTKLTDVALYDNVDKKYRLKCLNGKYSPLNLDKRTTIEIRIFSSPESYEEVCAKLDFVQALVHFTNPYIVNTKMKYKYNWSAFKTFVQQHRKQYSDLITYFKEDFA